ncbi:helix-turn-helix domain-containing protein [Clostridium botulinum]|uniref:helix-turn-helix domain-containing protein n=1 Tax=Clostridium botulinum TaxID=1491 RepID=UPI00196711A7|nr:helix-turn-helix domain-containing protein [Clostridium botulinum]MBN1050308.1 hypothetical protein [Clostridium botulinum]
MDISKEIKKVMIDMGIGQVELASKLGVTQQNISAKFKKNDFRISEMKQIATALGYELKIEFIKK